MTVFTVTPTGEIRCPAESCHQQLTRLIIDVDGKSISATASVHV